MTQPDAAPDAIDEAARLLGPLARRDAPLGALTTYRVGGPAALGVSPQDQADLQRVAAVVAATAVPVLIVGKGSNMLVADAGFAGLAVVMDAPHWSEVTARDVVTAGGGASLPVVARRSAAAGLVGLEWAVGVPGSVGGAVRMNAGGHGSDIASCLIGAWVLDLATAHTVWRTPASLGFGYRTSSLGATDVVILAELRCREGSREAAEREIGEIVAWRRANQPGGQNAGSVFTNPPGDAAGRLIDEAGLKGLRIGTAQVSAKHANFVQADEGGSADDVKRVIDEVRARVLARHGIELRTEVRLIGFPGTYREGV